MVNNGRGFQVDFDLLAHRLDVATTDGERLSTALEPGPVADFYARIMALLERGRRGHRTVSIYWSISSR